MVEHGGGLPRRELLARWCAIGGVGLAGCSADGIGDSNDAPDGESAAFEWETFTYPSLDFVFERHRWDDRETVRLFESPDIDGQLQVPRSNVPGIAEFVDATDFEASFLLAIDMSFDRSPYTFEVVDVLWGPDDEEVVVDGVREGDGAEPGGHKVVTLVRVSVEDREVPGAARVVYERETPREGEDERGEFRTYPAESYTGISLLVEDEDGDLVMDGYPSVLRRGEPQRFVLVVRNFEETVGEYTVVTQLQRVEREGSSLVVTEREELDRFGVEVDIRESRPTRLDVTPTLVGEDLRLVVLLYEGEPPAEPTKENALHSLHLWLDVTE